MFPDPSIRMLGVEGDLPVRRRILFVDDEQAILAGLERLLRRDRSRWDMVFALGGQRGLDEVRKQPFDVVVSDLGMPGISGTAMLNAIGNEYPATALIAFSGLDDCETVVRTIPMVGRVLTKPCDVATLRDAIETSAQEHLVDQTVLVDRPGHRC